MTDPITNPATPEAIFGKDAVTAAQTRELIAALAEALDQIDAWTRWVNHADTVVAIEPEVVTGLRIIVSNG